MKLQLRSVAVVASLCLAAVVGMALMPSDSTSSVAPGAVVAQPYLGPGGTRMRLLGVAAGGVAGETWGALAYNKGNAVPLVGGNPLQFGAVAPGDRSPQLVIFRHTDATGWQAFDTPRNADGSPYRGFSPIYGSARITEHGGGVLVGRENSTAKLLLKQPGATESFKLLQPPAEALTPSEPGAAQDRFAPTGNSERVPVVAFEEAGKTSTLLASIGTQSDHGVIYYNAAADSWAREPIELASELSDSFRILAIDGTGADNMWLLGRSEPASGPSPGVMLFKRVVDGDDYRWVSQPLGLSTFELRSPSPDVSSLGALDSAVADPLTVTPNGLWIDGRLTAEDAGQADFFDFTLYFDRSADRITNTWCDARVGGAALCDSTLGFKFSDGSSFRGYQSIAWAGTGFGTRVISRPLRGGAGDFNSGSFISLADHSFQRVPGAGGSDFRDAAFRSANDGWLPGLVRVSASYDSGKLASWPIALRNPLLAVATEPGQRPGALAAMAISVGVNGGVARYVPGAGWTPEYLLTSGGSVAKDTLRAVAWPSAGRAYAVGNAGAMWLWRSETGLWEKDPGAPIGFIGNLMGVAFDPQNESRGYAVGRDGALLSYGKGWTQATSGAATPAAERLPLGFEHADFLQITFSGTQAVVVARKPSLETVLLVNNGSGWTVDSGAAALLAAGEDTRSFVTVAGTADGGAVAGGSDGLLLERDSAGGEWRYADQPLSGQTIIAASAFREGSRVRAVVSVVPNVLYPPYEEPLVVGPGQPLPVLPALDLPGDGYVLRETASGWSDQQRMSHGNTREDKPLKSDPVLAFALDRSGEGWALGGWSGQPDNAGRGLGTRGALAAAVRDRVQTAGIYRYAQGSQVVPTGSQLAPIPMAQSGVNFAVGGHSACERACADLGAVGIAPDRTLGAALASVAQSAALPQGPQFFLYTGGRTPPDQHGPQAADEANRFAQLLGSQPALPVYPALSEGDSTGDTAAAFSAAFANFAAPLGGGAASSNIRPVSIGQAATPGARTHYAFDYIGPGGPLRVAVVDNSSGTLDNSTAWLTQCDPSQDSSDSYQNPPDGSQALWLKNVLLDARQLQIASIVLGSRDLNSQFSPRINTALDADCEAKLMRDAGASAYFFDRPEENRQYAIPSGTTDTIPSFGSGALGYKPQSGGAQPGQSSADFFDAGYLIVNVNVAARAANNRAPVTARLIPQLSDLSLEAVDGTLLRRSRPAVFRGLGRRPTAGDRWGESGSPVGAGSYTRLPPEVCVTSGCATRVTPDFEFKSSDPDIGAFVARDPNSASLRKPLLTAQGKTIADASSGLFCAFNAGSTTVTVSAGGLAYSRVVKVQAGSVNPPCGTTPLNAGRFTGAKTPAAASPPPPPPAAAAPLALIPPPLPAAPSAPAPPFVAAAVPFVPTLQATPTFRAASPPPAPTLARPIPPGGAVSRVEEEQRETEYAFEESQAFSRYVAADHMPPPSVFVGLALLAAFAGVSIRHGRGRSTPIPAYVGQSSTSAQPDKTRRYP